ncbi:MAG: hypothetical protein AABZ02_05875 [Bacteroidota bacterium]
MPYNGISGILVPLYGIPPYVYYYCDGKSGTDVVCRDQVPFRLNLRSKFTAGTRILI